MARIRDLVTEEWLQKLKPGSEISVDECEQLTGVNRGSDPMAYQFAMLQLRQEVEKRLHRIQRMWTVRTIQGRLIVLTHRMASAYNQSTFRSGRRKLHRSNKRLKGVNVASFTKEELAEHDKALIRQGMILSAVTSQEHVPIAATTRSVPSMRPQ